jgi:hypothetical protein
MPSVAAAAAIAAVVVETGEEEAEAEPASAVAVVPVLAAGALASGDKSAAERASAAAKVAERVSAAEGGPGAMPAHGSRRPEQHNHGPHSLERPNLEQRSQRRAWRNPRSRAATIALGLASTPMIELAQVWMPTLAPRIARTRIATAPARMRRLGFEQTGTTV